MSDDFLEGWIWAMVLMAVAELLFLVCRTLRRAYSRRRDTDTGRHVQIEDDQH
jgi:hypothetical protein